jgi:hypothetical protein
VTVTAPFTIAPIAPSLIRPESRRQIYWTNVSIITKVWTGLTDTERCVLCSAGQYQGIANTIVQLIRRSTSGAILAWQPTGPIHLLMHRRRLIALDEMRFVAVSDQQRVEFVVRNAREDRGIRDLVALEVQHRQDGPIPNGIEEFILRQSSCQRRTAAKRARSTGLSMLPSSLYPRTRTLS